MDSDKGTLNALFDFSFSTFITTRLIKILYILAIIAAGIAAFGIIVSGFAQGFFAGLLSCIVAVLAFAIYVIMARIWLELIIVIFRISENVDVIAKAKHGADTPPAPPRSPGSEDNPL